MKKLKTLNYKILSTLPVISVCLATTQQTSSAMFRSAFSSFSRFIQRSTQSTINPSSQEVKYIYRNGSRIAITHTGSLKNSNLNQTSGISTTTSPSSSTNTLSRTSSAPATTSTSTPSPNPSLNVRPKTSTSSTLQSQSTNNTMSNRDNKDTSSTAIINTTSTSTSSPNSDSSINPKTYQSSQSIKTTNMLNVTDGYILSRILNNDTYREQLARRLANSALELMLKHDYNRIKILSDSLNGKN